MKILVVSSYLPYPLYSGGHIRLFNLLKHLAKEHEIFLVCERRPHQGKKEREEVEKFCKKVIAVERKKQWSVKNIIKTGFSFHPFLITGHTSSDLTEAIQTILQEEKIDILHAETSYIMQNIPTTSIPIVLVEHNIEYLVYKRYVDYAPFILRPLLYIDVWKLYREEKKFWQRATKLIAVSEIEKKKMKRKDVVIIPNGVDIQKFTFKKSQPKTYHSAAKHITMPEKTILFIGDFKWIQNRDTAKWIIADIWPFLLRSVEAAVKIKMWFVGKHIPESLKRLNTFDSVVFDENAPKDTTEIFHRADLLLSPTRVGGGTSYKILEAMASGVPVVTTDLGISGIDAQEGVHAFVGNDVRSIVEKTSRLLRDKELYERIAKNARKLIEEKYDWRIIAKDLVEVYKSVL